MKRGVLRVLLITFVFLIFSSLSMADMTCVNDNDCDEGYVCMDSICIQQDGHGTFCPETKELRTNISSEFGIMIYDKCELDSDQLRVVYSLLKSVPKRLYKIEKITTTGMGEGNKYDSYTLVIQDIPVGEFFKDSIPDGIEQQADRFSLHFVNRFNRNIRDKYYEASSTLKYREYHLITSAGENHSNYLRNDYPDGYFFAYPNRSKFFPAIAEAYFQDSNLTLHLAIKKFFEGYTHPINQFLFFARVYSLNLNRTEFYNLDGNGNIETENVSVNATLIENKKYINSLTFEGFTYKFSLHSNGSVKNITVMKNISTPPVHECRDGTPYGECSQNETWGRPWYCDKGTLVENCSVCGCPEGFYCEENICIEIPKQCDDGTLYGECSQTRPYYCDNGTLVENCSVCGCYLYSYCNESGSCQYNQTYENHPPAMNTLQDINATEGETVEFYVSGYDPDQDAVSFYSSGLPEGASFVSYDVSKMKFHWVPNYEQAGSYEAIFTISDGEFNTSKKVLINISNVNRRPKAKISYPLNGQEFYVGELARFSGDYSVDPDGDEIVYVWNLGDGNKIQGPVMVNHTYGDPGVYNVTLEVSDGELSAMDSISVIIKSKEEPIPDEDRDGVENSRDRCPGTPYPEKVNMYGCPLPEYRKFNNDLTTDFSKIDLINATNVTIGVPHKAKIEFRKNILNLVGKNIDKHVKIERNSIQIDTENIPELNKSAVITFYDIGIKEPVILRDGLYCYDCGVIESSEDMIKFSVPHFTRYSLMAWASYSGYCGDKLCSIYETCYDCSIDCGECKEEIPAPGQCQEQWVCGAWSGCSELNLKTRECNDVNLCGTTKNKPKEAMECKEEPFPSLGLFGLFVVILLAIYLLAGYLKKKGEKKELGKFEINEIIRGYIYRGFTKEDIKKALKAKGYTEKEIRKMLKEFEKEMF